MIELKFICEFFGCDCCILIGRFIHKFYYYVLIFIELYFGNFRPLTCFSVMITDAV